MKNHNLKNHFLKNCLQNVQNEILPFLDAFLILIQTKYVLGIPFLYFFLQKKFQYQNPYIRVPPLLIKIIHIYS